MTQEVFSQSAGIEVVVRKDMVCEGAVMIFAPMETALNLSFLSVNNQFGIGEYELNDNAREAWKLKTNAFYSREQKLIDAGEVDMEMMTGVDDIG